MATTSPNLGLTLWTSNTDPFSPSQLANNFTLIDNQFSAVTVSVTPIRFVEPLASLPVTSLSNGRLVYLTAANGGFPANTILRYDGTKWQVVGPPDIEATLPTSGNYQGRIVILSAAVSGFSIWDVVINTDGANSWQKVGGVVTSSTVAGFTNNFAGKLGVLTSADSGFSAYSLLVYNGTAWNAVGGVPTGNSFPGSPYTGQVFLVTAATGNFQINELAKYNGSAWNRAWAQGFVTSAQLTALTSVPDGFEVYYQADSANGVYWHLRYNASSASAYKWECLGGSALFSGVNTSESTTSTSYAALTTAGPSVTVPRAGDYDIEIGFQQTSTVGGNLGAMSFDIGGTGAVDANAAIAGESSGVGNLEGSAWRKQRLTGLAASTALVSKYKTGSGQTAYFAYRAMYATPIRIA